MSRNHVSREEQAAFMHRMHEQRGLRQHPLTGQWICKCGKPIEPSYALECAACDAKRRQFTVLVDPREKRPLRFRNVNAERATLPTGDYSIKGFTGSAAIERKSLTDLVNCCARERDRFMDCCRRLRDYELRAIVVEASVDDVLEHRYRSKTHPQAVIGTTIAILVDYGVPTHWAGNPENAADFVERALIRYATRPTREEADR